MTTATDTTFRAIYTCRNRQCKRVWALDYRTDGTDYFGLPYGTRELKPSEQAGLGDRYNGGRRSYTVDVMGDLRCPDCGCNLPKGGRIKGHYMASIKCGPRCLNAKGGSCDCQCGGKNHGSNHL